MAPHPCCGRSLQLGTKVIAILQMIGSVFTIFGAILLLFGLAVIAPPSDEIAYYVFGFSNKCPFDVIGAALAIEGIFVLIIGSFSLIFGILLLKGADKRDIEKCRTWLIGECILTDLLILMVVLVSILKGTAGSVGIFVFFVVIIEWYFIWIVWAFIEELKVEAAGGGRRDVDGSNPIVLNKV